MPECILCHEHRDEQVAWIGFAEKSRVLWLGLQNLLRGADGDESKDAAGDSAAGGDGGTDVARPSSSTFGLGAADMAAITAAGGDSDEFSDDEVADLGDVVVAYDGPGDVDMGMGGDGAGAGGAEPVYELVDGAGGGDVELLADSSGESSGDSSDDEDGDGDAGGDAGGAAAAASGGGGDGSSTPVSMVAQLLAQTGLIPAHLLPHLQADGHSQQVLLSLQQALQQAGGAAVPQLQPLLTAVQHDLAASGTGAGAGAAGAGAAGAAAAPAPASAGVPGPPPRLRARTSSVVRTAEDFRAAMEPTGGVHLQFCGHTMHPTCAQKYRIMLLDKVRPRARWGGDEGMGGGQLLRLRHAGATRD